MFDPSFYEQCSETVWFKIYDYHIGVMTALREEEITFMASYIHTLHSHALRDMERQALLGELRRVNWQPTYTKPQSIALVATP